MAIFWYIYVRILGCKLFGSSCAIKDGRFYESRNSKLMFGREVFFYFGSPCMVCESFLLFFKYLLHEKMRKN